MKRSIVLAILLAAAASIVAQPSFLHIDVPAGGVVVPMLDIGGRPMIDLLVNGKGPYPFILDTGASMTAVDAALTGEPAADEPTRIDEVRIGAMVVRGLIAGKTSGMLGRLSSAPNPPRGVLSAAAFPGYLVTLDYPGKRVIIAPGALPAPDGKRVFGYGANDVLPIVPVRVAGREFRIHLDSGSPGSVMLPTRFAAELPLDGALVDVGHARTVAGEFTIQQASVKGAVEVGQYTLDVSKIYFSDLRPGPEPGIGNVGAQVLRGFLVTLDSKNRRVGFERPKP
jgi:hypothetical protein